MKLPPFTNTSICLILLLQWSCKPDDKAQIPTISNGYSTPEKHPGMSLVWADEFDGDRLDATDWSHEIGGHGWGNNELQFYQPENAVVENGYLIITAKKENKDKWNYTSSRIITKGKREFQYGRVDIRACLPKGKGIWPALWMLGNNISNVGWPECGEIDIMEMIGGEAQDNTVHGTAHWDSAGTHTSKGGKVFLKEGKVFADEFHVFSIVWTPTSIMWLLDDVHFFVMDTTTAEVGELQNSFFFIFNVAVGGNWPGNPNETTIFPQRLIVDYVRMFQPS